MFRVIAIILTFSLILPGGLSASPELTVSGLKAEHQALQDAQQGVIDAAGMISILNADEMAIKSIEKRANEVHQARTKLNQDIEQAKNSSKSESEKKELETLLAASTSSGNKFHTQILLPFMSAGFAAEALQTKECSKLKIDTKTMKTVWSQQVCAECTKYSPMAGFLPGGLDETMSEIQSKVDQPAEKNPIAENLRLPQLIGNESKVEFQKDLYRHMLLELAGRMYQHELELADWNDPKTAKRLNPESYLQTFDSGVITPDSSYFLTASNTKNLDKSGEPPFIEQLQKQFEDQKNLTQKIEQAMKVPSSDKKGWYARELSRNLNELKSAYQSYSKILSNSVSDASKAFSILSSSRPDCSKEQQDFDSRQKSKSQWEQSKINNPSEEEFTNLDSSHHRMKKNEQTERRDLDNCLARQSEWDQASSKAYGQAQKSPEVIASVESLNSIRDTANRNPLSVRSPKIQAVIAGLSSGSAGMEEVTYRHSDGRKTVKKQDQTSEKWLLSNLGDGGIAPIREVARKVIYGSWNASNLGSEAEKNLTHLLDVAPGAMAGFLLLHPQYARLTCMMMNELKIQQVDAARKDGLTQLGLMGGAVVLAPFTGGSSLMALTMVGGTALGATAITTGTLAEIARIEGRHKDAKTLGTVSTVTGTAAIATIVTSFGTGLIRSQFARMGKIATQSGKPLSGMSAKELIKNKSLGRMEAAAGTMGAGSGVADAAYSFNLAAQLHERNVEKFAYDDVYQHMTQEERLLLEAEVNNRILQGMMSMAFTALDFRQFAEGVARIRSVNAEQADRLTSRFLHASDKTEVQSLLTAVKTNQIDTYLAKPTPAENTEFQVELSLSGFKASPGDAQGLSTSAPVMKIMEVDSSSSDGFQGFVRMGLGDGKLSTEGDNLLEVLVFKGKGEIGWDGNRLLVPESEIKNSAKWNDIRSEIKLHCGV